jgi:hypothetical protein
VTYANRISGNDASNYVLSSNGGTVTANIDPALLTVGGTTVASNKTYDGNTNATVTGGTISSVVEGDTVSFAQTGAFVNKNAGTDKPVTYMNSISGADAGNYVLSSNGGTVTANIDQATLVYILTSVGAERPFGTPNPALTGIVTGLVGGETLASVASGSAVFTTDATVSSSSGTYAITGGGLTLTSPNYTLVQVPGALTVHPITISIGDATKMSGSPNPTFTLSYPGPSSDYLASVLSSLKLVTNAPLSDVAGNYQITALVPSELAGSILVQPGTFRITANNNNVLVNDGSPQVIAGRPAALDTQPPAPPQPLPFVTGGASVMDQLIPGNAISRFQILFTPMQAWGAATGQPDAPQGSDAYLSSASFTETSPDGRTQDNKSVYAAGARK